MWRTTIAPFESLGKKFRKTYLSNKSQPGGGRLGRGREGVEQLGQVDGGSEPHDGRLERKGVFFLFEKNLSRMERCQRTATTSTRRMCSSQLTWELASIACPSRGPASSLRGSELSVLRWGSKRFPDGTAKPVGGNVFVKICNHSYIFSCSTSCVEKEKMILIISNNCVPLSTLNVEGSFRRSQKFRSDFNKVIQSFPISI